MTGPRTETLWTCDRCGQERAPQFRSLSRTDNKSYICEGCGTAEASEDYHSELTPREEWPVAVGS